VLLEYKGENLCMLKVQVRTRDYRSLFTYINKTLIHADQLIELCIVESNKFGCSCIKKNIFIN